jgi:hypothetical protein
MIGVKESRSLNKFLFEKKIKNATLAYSKSVDGLKNEKMWEKLETYDETLILIKTEINVIGVYLPEPIIETSDAKPNRKGWAQYKEIDNDGAIIFYFKDGQFKTVKPKKDSCYLYYSNDLRMFEFPLGLEVSNDNDQGKAYVRVDYWDWQDDTHHVKRADYYGRQGLYIAGGDDE